LLLKSSVLVVVAMCLGCASAFVKPPNPLVVPAVKDALEYDQPPSMVNATRPVYPDFAREVRAEGRVILKVLVLEDGSVGAIQVLESSHPLLVDNAVDAICHSVFSPARRDGTPVAATVVMPFVFTLDPNLIRTSITEEPPTDIGTPGLRPSEPPRRDEPDLRPGK